jgi:YebC/PmpR family DNA-binding regulatory protein
MGRGPSIEGRKNAEDARRGKLFTKFIREITVAARAGGADPASNSRLRLAMDKALHANMSKDTLERAIKRGSGEAGAENFEEVRYEGYAPGGAAIMLDCLTDNPTRTVAEVRHAFSKNGGNLGTSGSVSYLFNKQGQILIETHGDTTREEKILETALEAGADDVISHDDVTEILTTPENLEPVKKALIAAGQNIGQADLAMRPATQVDVVGGAAESVRTLIQWLEDLDDVQKVYSNARLPDA